MYENEISSDAKNRIKNIKLYAYNQQQQIKLEEKRCLDEFYELNEKISNLYPRVKDILAVAYCCIENNVPLFQFKKKDKENEFISFEISSGKIMLSLETSNSMVGMYAGRLGLCNWNGISILMLKDDINLTGYNEPMKKFVENFNDFECRFYEYVDDIVLDKKIISMLNITNNM